LIAITENDAGEPAVSGWELHAFLEVETPYLKWFQRMCAYGFTEGEDYQEGVLDKNVQNLGGRPACNHAISLDMAKEISMIQRTEKGKQARQYFIECEKRLRRLGQESVYYVSLQNLRQEMERQQEGLNQRLAFIETILGGLTKSVLQKTPDLCGEKDAASQKSSDKKKKKKDTGDLPVELPNGTYRLSAVASVRGNSQWKKESWYYKVTFNILGTSWDGFQFVCYFNIGNVLEKIRKQCLKEWTSFLEVTGGTGLEDVLYKPFMGTVQGVKWHPWSKSWHYVITQYESCSPEETDTSKMDFSEMDTPEPDYSEMDTPEPDVPF
jgi:phage anti-repressor protein